MTVTIAHLYYDLLNLYGENGNVKTLEMNLKKLGIKSIVKKLSVDDEFTFADYDFVYIGTGTEDNQKSALKHLFKYKEDIKKAIADNKFFLVTGNSLELFGKSITDITGKKYQALKIFNFTAVEQNKQQATEVICEFPDIDDNVIGFQNQRSNISKSPYPLFKIIKGIGTHINNEVEGILYNNFYGTYIIGPILIRNPKFLKFIIKKLIESSDKDFTFEELNTDLDNLAYNEFTKEKIGD